MEKKPGTRIKHTYKITIMLHTAMSSFKDDTFHSLKQCILSENIIFHE